MGNYYCLIAGLPELQPDNQKLKLSLSDFKTELKENLSSSDFGMISYFFMQFDNKNLLALLANPEVETGSLGNLTREEILEIISQFKESENPQDKRIYTYFRMFLPDFFLGIPIFPTLSWEDQLTTLYYDFAIGCKNKLISEWYRFNLNISNILIGLNCRRFGFDKEKSVVGSNEVSEAIRKSNAKDFGIAPIFPEVEDIIRIADEPDLYERERKIDLLKWNWLEEKGAFHYFDMEHLFVYLVRLNLIERWLRLEKETGKKVFREVINQLQHSFGFPNEFTIKGVR